jgi:hypothetical protein
MTQRSLLAIFAEDELREAEVADQRKQGGTHDVKRLLGGHRLGEAEIQIGRVAVVLEVTLASTSSASAIRVK